MITILMLPELEGIPRPLVERFHLDALPFHQRHAGVTQLMSLTGRRALVTGGGGGGLGQACCHRLASLGAAVAVCDVDVDAAQRVAGAVGDRWGVETTVVSGSVSVWAEAKACIDQTLVDLGGLDVLVNNAGGVFGRQFGPFAGLSRESADSLVRRNLLGTMYSTRAALDWMLPAGSGRIINIASEGGKVAMRDIALYNACKAGVIGFTRSLAHEVGPHGVSVVAVCPGVMMSEGLLALLQKEGADAAVRSIEHGYERTTIGRASLPEEVANMVAFLATDAASFVHGTAVSVGGGLSG